MPSPLRVSPTFSDLHPAGDFQAVISSIEETEGLYGKQFKFLINTAATFKRAVSCTGDDWCVCVVSPRRRHGCVMQRACDVRGMDGWVKKSMNAIMRFYPIRNIL